MAKFSNSNCQSTLTDVSLNASNSNNQPNQADSVYTEQQIVFNWFIYKHGYTDLYDRQGNKTKDSTITRNMIRTVKYKDRDTATAEFIA